MFRHLSKASNAFVKKDFPLPSASSAGSAASNRALEYATRDMNRRMASQGQGAVSSASEQARPRDYSRVPVPRAGDRSQQPQHTQQQTHEQRHGPGQTYAASNTKAASTTGAGAGAGPSTTSTTTSPSSSSSSGPTSADIETAFAESRFSHIFDQPRRGPSYFASMKHGSSIYFAGTRRIFTPGHEADERSELYLRRTLDTVKMKMIDRIVGVDLESGMPMDSDVITNVAADGSRGQVIDTDEETGAVRSRTFVRLRGTPWAWESAMAICKYEPASPPSASHAEGAQEDGAVAPAAAGKGKDAPTAFTVSRVRFEPDGYFAEKIVKFNGQVLFTIVDELKMTTEAQFRGKTEQMFKMYSEDVSSSLTDAANDFDASQGQSAGIFEELPELLRTHGVNLGDDLGDAAGLDGGRGGGKGKGRRGSGSGSSSGSGSGKSKSSLFDHLSSELDNVQKQQAGGARGGTSSSTLSASRRGGRR